MGYLEDWSSLEREYVDSLSGTVEALTASILCLPVTDGAKVVNGTPLYRLVSICFSSVLCVSVSSLLLCICRLISKM